MTQRDTAMPHCSYDRLVADEHIFVAVQSRGVIAIPPAIRRHFGLDQPGAQVEVIERDGEIVLRPHVAVPADQSWFWTERWQEMERGADAAISAGRLKAVEGVDELLADLES
jgi:antitoxin MazE